LTKKNDIRKTEMTVNSSCKKVNEKAKLGRIM